MILRAAILCPAASARSCSVLPERSSAALRVSDTVNSAMLTARNGRVSSRRPGMTESSFPGGANDGSRRLPWTPLADAVSRANSVASFAFNARRSRQASRLRSGERSRKAGWNIGRVGSGASRPGTARSNQRPRSRVIPSATSSSELAAVPPASTSTLGRDSTIWRNTKGRHAAISAAVGLRLPGGRQ